LRRLAIALLVAGAGLGFASGSQAGAQTSVEVPPPVDVFEVSGLVDPILADQIDQAIDRAEENGAQALVLQLNSKQAVVSRERMAELAAHIAHADIPVTVWVGPSGARAFGLPGQLIGAAAASGMAPGTRVGDLGLPLEVDGVPLEFGTATDTLTTKTLGADDARAQGVLKLETNDRGVPVLRNMISAIDGLTFNGKTLRTVYDAPDEDGVIKPTVATPRFFKLGLMPRLFHTVGSPPVAYLFFIIGAALLLFEFFTAGVGVAGVLGVVCLVFGCYGFGALPVRGWALAAIIVSFAAFAIDVQVGVPRLWTGVGMVLFTLGSVLLYREGIQMSWVTLLFGVSGIALTFINGMPSMVRTRFATPTIGREWMIGELGDAVGELSPTGVVLVSGAKWRARTNRATPIAGGDRVRVTAIDGVTLEVEPEEGAARDYRERRAKS
jgi:membrane-bound serine protease (ClpP class)